jgi:hypothetical protein
MSTTQFIDELAAGNASGAKDILNDMLSARAFEALEGRKVEIAQNIFNGSVQEEQLNLEDYSLEELEEFMVSEEFEQLDELSKSTLGSYVNKASKNAALYAADSVGMANVASRARNPRVKAAANKYSDESHEKRMSRLAGVGKAVKKLTK